MIKLGRSPYRICSPQLPLAVYREVAAHLQQVIGIEVEILPQTSQTFDYTLSQVGGLSIHYPPTATSADLERVEQILAYYGDRYGAWQVLAE